MKKTKRDIIEVGEFEEKEEKEDMTIMKWRDFEVLHLVAIQGKIDTKKSKNNKQIR